MVTESYPELSRLLQRVLPGASAQCIALPLVPAIELFLINSDFDQRQITEQDKVAIMERPAYWAFCWASGQVLAQFILDQPQWVHNKRVLDFGCGSGVVAIAAALAGAKSVIACDIDPDALAATAINAAHNGCELILCDDFNDIDEALDIIIVADVLYDRANIPWLKIFEQSAKQVLVADSRVKNFNYPPYHLIASQRADTVPDMDEFDEFRDVSLYALGDC